MSDSLWPYGLQLTRLLCPWNFSGKNTPLLLLEFTNIKLNLKTPKELILGTSLVVQWLNLHTSTAGGVGVIPGGITKILHAMGCMAPQKLYYNHNLESIISHSFYWNGPREFLKLQLKDGIPVLSNILIPIKKGGQCALCLIYTLRKTCPKTGQDLSFLWEHHQILPPLDLVIPQHPKSFICFNVSLCVDLTPGLGRSPGGGNGHPL